MCAMRLRHGLCLVTAAVLLGAGAAGQEAVATAKVAEGDAAVVVEAGLVLSRSTVHRHTAGAPRGLASQEAYGAGTTTASHFHHPRTPVVHQARGSGTEVTHKSWGTRLMESLGACVFGFVLFFFTIALLMANEGTFVTRMRVVDRVAQQLKEREAAALGSGDGVYYGDAVIDNSVVSDDQFGVCVSGLRLKRTVEMYQHKEHVHTKTEKDNFGGGETTTTTYTLSQQWSEFRLELSGKAPGTPQGGNPMFPNVNGALAQSDCFNGAIVFNNMPLSDSLVSELQDWQPLNAYEATPVVSGYSALTYKPSVCSVYIPYQGARYFAPQGAGGGTYPSYPSYGGVDGGPLGPNTPNIGDMRVSWEVVKSDRYSLLCGQERGRLQHYVVEEVPPYTLPGICYPCACCGLGAVLINLFTSATNVVGVLRRGSHPPGALLQTLHTRANTFVWLFRVVGFICFYLAVSMILAPIPTLFDVVGIVGTIVSYGTSFIAFLVALTATPATIAVCWIAYRPHIALLIFAIPAIMWLLTVYFHAGAPPQAPV